MTTRFFDLIKFSYQRDDGSELVRVQRVEQNLIGDRLTPITATFLTRQVLHPSKLLGSSLLGLRAAIATTATGDFPVAVVYRGDDSRHRSQMREIQSLPTTLCVGYRGEQRVYA